MDFGKHKIWSSDDIQDKIAFINQQHCISPYRCFSTLWNLVSATPPADISILIFPPRSPAGRPSFQVRMVIRCSLQTDGHKAFRPQCRSCLANPKYMVSFFSCTLYWFYTPYLAGNYTISCCRAALECRRSTWGPPMSLISHHEKLGFVKFWGNHIMLEERDSKCTGKLHYRNALSE